ncbi:MAG: hypothetical protein JOZ09_16725 [Pseudonocardiales bacterium]|nr:hypothetical protein [Pseudonocardiales bacterium]
MDAEAFTRGPLGAEKACRTVVRQLSAVHRRRRGRRCPARRGLDHCVVDRRPAGAPRERRDLRHCLPGAVLLELVPGLAPARAAEGSSALPGQSPWEARKSGRCTGDPTAVPEVTVDHWVAIPTVDLREVSRWRPGPELASSVQVAVEQGHRRD